MMTDMTMDNFLAVLSSSEPVPGGGGACGYVAAVGMSLGNMVLAQNGQKPMPCLFLLATII